MTLNVAIFVFDEVEVLDFAGPYEVFSTASRVHRRGQPTAPEPFKVYTVAKTAAPVRARAGLVVHADHRIDDHPAIDLLVVPGGVVTAELQAPAVANWIAAVARSAQIMASVCTGAFLLAQAGLLNQRRATTHWEDTAELKAMFPALTVIEQRRWIDEGAVVTSAGISAGIDMCLHLVERLAGRDLAVRTARQMDFLWHEDR